MDIDKDIDIDTDTDIYIDVEHLKNKFKPEKTTSLKVNNISNLLAGRPPLFQLVSKLATNEESTLLTQTGSWKKVKGIYTLRRIEIRKPEKVLQGRGPFPSLT